MTGLPGADLFVIGIRCRAAGISRSSRVDALGFPKAPLCAPEASKREHSLLQAVFERALQWIAVYKVRINNAIGLSLLQSLQLGYEARQDRTADKNTCAPIPGLAMQRPQSLQVVDGKFAGEFHVARISACL